MSWSRRTPTPLPPRPDCMQVGSVLQSYLDGELGPQDAERVAEHLEHCERCGIEAHTIERVVGTIRAQRPDLDVEVLDRLGRFVTEIERHAAGGDAPPQ